MKAKFNKKHQWVLGTNFILWAPLSFLVVMGHIAALPGPHEAAPGGVPDFWIVYTASPIRDPYGIQAMMGLGIFILLIAVPVCWLVRDGT